MLMVALNSDGGGVQNLFNELRRRNMFRVAGVYAVVSWLLVQVSAALEAALTLPAWFDGLVVALLGIGFPITMIMAWAFELTPDGVKPTQAVAPGESIAPKTGRKLDMAILGGLALVAVLVGWQTLSKPGGATAAKVADVVDTSIAVLPFVDLSPAGDQEYFADGISEELLNVLAQAKEMKVAGRTSSFAFKGRNEDLREIGKVLGVAHILEGSVRKSGDTVRITAQLIKADDGFHLWSETYDRRLTNIFDVQDEIAAAILGELQTQFASGGAAPAAPAIVRGDVDAYALYLKAKPLIASRIPDNMEEAEKLLDQAIKIDPDYAPAYALRSMVESLLSDAPGAYGKKPAAQAIVAATAFADKALEIDPDLAEAHAVRGLIHLDGGESSKAIASLQRAVEINPNNLDARNWLSLALGANGRYRDIAEEQWALFQIDPLYPPGVNNSIIHLLNIGDVDRARQVVERVKEIAPDTATTLGGQSTFLASTGEVAQGIVLGERSFAMAPNTNSGFGLAFARLSLGDFAGARKNDYEYLEQFILALEGNRDEAVAASKAQLDQSPDYYQSQIDYIGLLSADRRYEELAAYYRATWPDVAAFEKSLYSGFSGSLPPFGEVAQALFETGDAAEAQKVMARWRTAIDIARAGGADAPGWDMEDGNWHVLKADLDKALVFYNNALDSRGSASLFAIHRLDTFASLAADPRFQALRARMVASINEQRAILGLSPLPVLQN